MSLFSNFEVNTTKKTTYDWVTEDYTVSINIIRMTPEETMLFDQEFATYHANVGGINAQYIVKGAGIKVGADRYMATNDVKQNKIFSDKYSVRLRKING